MSDPAGLDPADWSMWRAFSGMREALDRALEQRVQRDAGISTADFDVLRSLAAAEGQQLRAGALAESLAWEKSRISHQVRRMADRGLVIRAECPTDARGTWVVLAPAGAEALAAASCGYVDVLRRAFFDGLTPAEKRALHAVSQRADEAIRGIGTEVPVG
jgi:DNA-binding MarR family transcriptional regulator